MTKWVGFDMDECIGSVMPLYAFVTKLPKAQEAIINALYTSENAKYTWLLRPAFYDTLIMLYHAYKNGTIIGAFIFSNNGSQELVDFMVYYSNIWIAKKLHIREVPSVFKMGVSRGSPLRSPGSLIKSISEIQGALAKKGLPLLTSSNDLIFFDDMVHELSGEIKDYVKVRPYLNLCPLDRVVNALAHLENIVGSIAWSTTVKLAYQYQNEDKDGRYIKTPPTAIETLQDTLIFHQALLHFLGQRAGALKSSSRKNRRFSRNKSRRRSRY